MASLTPFLYDLPNGTLAYEATRPGDLGHTFEIFKMYPDVAVRVTQVILDERLDRLFESGIFDFAECHGTTPDMSPIDYESTSDDGEETLQEFEARIIAQDGMDDEDCKKDATVEGFDDSHDTYTAPVVPTAQSIAASEQARYSLDSYQTAAAGNKDNVNSVVSESSSLDTVTELPRGIHFDHPPPTAATVKQRLQEAVDDFQLTWEVSRLDKNDNEVSPDQYLRLLRVMLAVCGNVAVLVLPESWKGVMDEVRGDYFPNLEELIVYRDELVGDDE